MIKKLTIAAMVAAFGITGCVTLPVDQVSAESYLGYQPMDPVPASKVTIYDSTSNSEKEIFWESIPDAESKRPLLPLQSAQISISKSDVSGKISYLVSSVSA